MKCYVIESGYTYEGGSADTVSLSLDKAIEVSLNMVENEKESDNVNDVWEKEYYMDLVRKNPEVFSVEDIPQKEEWREEDTQYIKYWTNGSKYILIKEIELV